MHGIVFLVVGGLAMILGLKGFSAQGLPLSKNKNITGGPAKAIGTCCMLVGLVFVLWWLYVNIAQH